MHTWVVTTNSGHITVQAEYATHAEYGARFYNKNVEPKVVIASFAPGNWSFFQLRDKEPEAK